MALSQTVSVQPGDRSEYIDAVRGLAALYIISYHLALIPQPNLAVPKWASPFVLNGGTAVTIFFMVSAFCLCSSMHFHRQEDGLNARFYLRRFFRIAPLFYFWIGLTLIRDRFWFGVTHSWTDILLSVFFVFNFVPGKQDGFVWASWILSVQMAFYLLFPIIYRYVDNLSKSVGFFFFALLVASGYNVFINYLPIVDVQRASFLQFSFLHHLPSFALGLVAYYLYDRFIRDKSIGRDSSIALTAAAAFGYTALLSGRLNVLFDGLYWQGVIYGIFLLALSIAPLGLFVNRITRFYGKISYSVYLNHPTLVFACVPVYRIIYGASVPASFQYGTCFLFTLGLLTAVSYCTHRFIEEPGMRLGKKLIRKVS